MLFHRGVNGNKAWLEVCTRAASNFIPHIQDDALVLEESSETSKEVGAPRGVVVTVFASSF